MTMMRTKTTMMTTTEDKPGKSSAGTLTVRALFVVGLLVMPTVVTAEGPAEAERSPSPAAPSGLPGLLYVIKVTPALVYLDGGESAVNMGERFLILRDSDRGEGLYDKVGEARVIRLFEEFSIAEILSVSAGVEIEVLQRAISAAYWEAMVSTAAMPVSSPPPWKPGAALGQWSIQLLGGVGLQKGIDLQDTIVTPAREITDASAGVRLGRTVASKFRLNLTLRISGDPLQAGTADVTQLSAELDGHYLFNHPGSVRPWVGIGAGLHRLTWDAPAGAEDSADKAGLNAMGGLDVPLGRNGWSLMLEGGYQGVVQWNDIIDASSIRVHVGIGKHL